MSHPNSLDLEAFACGERVVGIDEHLDTCEECQAFVGKLRSLPAPRIELPPKKPSLLPLFALPLAMAAALVLFLKQPSHGTASRAPHAEERFSTTEPTTTFKGHRLVAVIRERNGEQRRFVDRVPVREGDRLRLEVATDREESILAGVFSDDGQFLEFMPAMPRPAGTHYSDVSVRISPPASNGSILVGTEEDVLRARQRQVPVGLRSIRIEWEPGE